MKIKPERAGQLVSLLLVLVSLGLVVVSKINPNIQFGIWPKVLLVASIPSLFITMFVVAWMFSRKPDR